MRTRTEVEYEAALQRISELIGAPFPSDADALVKAVERKVAEEWNAAIEAAAKHHDKAGDAMRKWLDENEGRVNDTRTADRVEGMRVRLETHRASAVEIREMKREATPQRTQCDSCHERPRTDGLSVCQPCANSIYGRGREAK